MKPKVPLLAIYSEEECFGVRSCDPYLKEIIIAQ